MANYFSIENPRTVTNSTQKYGFVPHELNPVNINDSLIIHGDDLNKMGSSIPTPFARMFLFNLAFEQVNKEEEDKPGEGHKGFVDENDPNQQRIASGYHYLVSECLDMLEFIYKYGDNKKFGMHEWNFNSECKALNESKTQGHKELGRALGAPHEQHSPIQVIRDINEVYIFTWDGKIIGGTSPKTIVYTSPNLKEAIKGERFVGDQGNELFNNNVSTPLYQRTESFRSFMYRYLMINMDGKNNIHAIKKYIENSRDNYDQSLYRKLNIEENLEANPRHIHVKRLTDKKNVEIWSGNIELYEADNTPVLGDYLIEPTTQDEQWNREFVNGDPREVRKPMVLTRNGNNGFAYINGREWKRGADLIDKSLSNVPITERILPSTTYKYPYLTVDDFLESRIIEVSYFIRKEAFVTGTKSNVQHILPLKKEFFKYFRIEDLFDQKGQPSDMLQVSIDPDDEHITVKLNIPVKGGTLTLVKEYDESAKVDCYDAANTFDLAFFPFYRMINDGTTDNNVYNIMVGSTVKGGLGTKFYKIDDLKKRPQDQELQVSTTGRTTSDINTTHIHVEGAFDLMEVKVKAGENTVTGLLVPRFRMVDMTAATRQYHFCIDFGTTNTHVVYSDEKVGFTGHIDKEDVKPFDIGQEDCQVITLNDDDGVAEFVKFTTFMRREFVPLRIGGQNDRVSFPLRTATCQVDRKVDSLRMFDNTNIGFNYNEELATDNLTTCRYETNIKWNRKDALSRNRLKEYFTEMLWMMKNKAVLNGGTEDFTVIATYPQSMSYKEYENFIGAWGDAKVEVKSNVNLDLEFESIAPYYSYLSGLFGDTYANFDIGGGTTDILHVDSDTNEAVTLSAIFAANDIWGDGVGNPKNSNAFVKFYMKSEEFGKLSATDKETIKSVIKNSNSSADIISYLFSHDAKTNFTQAIETNKELMQIVITHFASLVYYLAYVIDLQMLKVPQKITFTGMGSKYIKIISGNERAIAEIIQAVFAYYAKLAGNVDMQNVDLTISFAENPKEVTACGGLLLNGHDHPIVPETTIFYGYDGEEPGTTMRYSDLDAKTESVMRIFKEQFLKLFEDTNFLDALDKVEYYVSEDFCTMLNGFASNSYKQQVQNVKDMAAKGQSPKLKEPVFFWPLKNALYMAGQKLINGE